MFRRFFGKKCEHDYHIIDEETKVFANMDKMEYDTATYYILYCPKCDKQKRIESKKYDRQQEIERIKKQYGGLNEDKNQ